MSEAWRDPRPARVGFDEWQELFERVPDELIERYHYFPPNREAWSKYLFPPQTFAIYGARHLRRLRFDNSLAALRLWGFVQNETERLFRARQVGRRVIAAMGDLGAVPVIVNAFPGCLAFYPDCSWWTPFVMVVLALLSLSFSPRLRVHTGGSLKIFQFCTIPWKPFVSPPFRMKLLSVAAVCILLDT